MIEDKDAREWERMNYWIAENESNADAIHEYFPELAHGSTNARRKKHPTRGDWERVFKNRLESYQIEVPYDFYDEALFNDDTNYVLEVFTNLEEDNLTIVTDTQDVE